MAYFSMFIGFAVLLCLVIAGLQNNIPLGIKFVLWNLQMSLPAVIFWAAAGGALVIGVSSLPKLAAKYFETRRLRKEVGRLEKLCNEEERLNR